MGPYSDGEFTACRVFSTIGTKNASERPKSSSNLFLFRTWTFYFRRIPMNLSRMLKKSFNSLLISLFVLSVSGVIFGQSGTSKISGMVTDQNDAAVAGATVIISNPATGFSRNTTTGEDGRYTF